MRTTTKGAVGAVEPPELVSGTVLAGPDLLVELPTHASPVRARRAKSCLVLAEPGDRVLCALDGEVVFILAVLEGAKDATHLEVGGALELTAKKVAIQSEEFAVRAAKLKLRTKLALFALEELRLLGRSVDAQVADRAALLAERVESHASRFFAHAKQSFRFVEEVDHTESPASGRGPIGPSAEKPDV
ncbi:MAG: DUF3540 domain-containing protein [Polyangiaceae bacterium]